MRNTMIEDRKSKFIQAIEDHQGQILRISSIYTENIEDRKDFIPRHRDECLAINE